MLGARASDGPDRDTNGKARNESAAAGSDFVIVILSGLAVLILGAVDGARSIRRLGLPETACARFRRFRVCSEAAELASIFWRDYGLVCRRKR